jgi:hypothetical protein
MKTRGFERILRPARFVFDAWHQGLTWRIKLGAWLS